MKTTIVGLVTPHLFRVVDLAEQAERGANVDWHVKDAVAKTVDELGQQYNARDLLAAYVQGLESAADGAGRMRKLYAGVLQMAVQTVRRLETRD